ncbi:MAG: histidine--tRNA ligase [Vampirovibrionales bacterium]
MMMHTVSQTKQLQRPKGMVDILPQQASQWRFLEDTLLHTLRLRGYQELRMPLLEHTELFIRGIGEETDVVSKEMFTFEKSERSLTLRPEGTAGAVRAFLENGLHRTPSPQKLCYLGPMFRYERPQAGRQRQFHQLGVELFGVASPAADAEVILTAWSLLQQAGIPKEAMKLELNSIGSGASRVAFVEGLKHVLAPMLEALCDNCQERFTKNPLRMLDCKKDGCQAHYQGEAVQAYLETSTHLNAQWDECLQVKAILEYNGLPVTVNRRLVRGLDYYTGVVFEVSSHLLGAQSAVCGGGRYDTLVESLGGSVTPATGFAIGLERLMMLTQPEVPEEPSVYIVCDAPSHAEAFKLSACFHQVEMTCEVDVSGRAFGKQLATAEKRHAAFALIQGEGERQAGHWQCKHLETRTQHTVEGSLEDIVTKVQALMHAQMPSS